MKVKNYIVFTALLLGIIGCSKAPVMEVYTLDVPQAEVHQSSQYRSKTIKVTYPQSLKEQISQKMNFSYSLNDRGSYQNSQWSNDMGKLLQGTIIDVLDRSRLFKAVFSSTTTLKVNYRLESNIFTFEHRVRENQSHAMISIQFTLINADTGKLVKSRRFSYQEATPSIDAKGYASASNRALNRLSQDLLLWIK